MPPETGRPALVQSAGQQIRHELLFQTTDTSNSNVVGPENKGASGYYVEIADILSRRRSKARKRFYVRCPYCDDYYQRWCDAEAVGPGYIVQYRSPSIRSPLALEDSLVITPGDEGEFYFRCCLCDLGTRCHEPGHPDRYRAERRLEEYRRTDSEGSR